MSQLEQSALKARNNLLFMFIAHVILDAILVAIAKDLWAIGRILVTIIVMYCFLQGHKWAKWFLVGLLSLLIVALIGLIVALYSKLSTILIVGSLVLIVLSVMILIYILSNQELKSYLLSRR